MPLKIGDWVQAVEEITEVFSNQVIKHATPGAVGHVISLTDEPGVVDVFFERTGTITIVHESEVKRLGGSETGRFPISDHR